MRAIVLAGGLGTRLLPVTKGVTPKGLANVAGVPILDRILDNLISCGIVHVCLALGHQADDIMTHYAHGYKGLELSFSIEPEPLGTGGAIMFALQPGEVDEILVLNGDTYVEIPLEAMRLDFSTGRQGTLLLTNVDDVARFGGVTIDGDKITSFSEKVRTGPGFISSGVCLTSGAEIKVFLNQVCPFSFEEVILASWVRNGTCGYVVTDSKFVDIGTPESFQDSQSLLG